MVLTGAVVLFEAGSVLQFTVGIFMSVIILDVQLRCVLLAVLGLFFFPHVLLPALLALTLP